MNRKQFESDPKDTKEIREIDPKLWDRLIWQEALDKAIKKSRDKRSPKNLSN